jgi:hypothetical protein
MMSISDDESIIDEELGHILTPLPDLKELAQYIQNRGARCTGMDQMEAQKLIICGISKILRTY